MEEIERERRINRTRGKDLYSKIRSDYQTYMYIGNITIMFYQNNEKNKI